MSTVLPSRSASSAWIGAFRKAVRMSAAAPSHPAWIAFLTATLIEIVSLPLAESSSPSWRSA